MEDPARPSKDPCRHRKPADSLWAACYPTTTPPVIPGSPPTDCPAGLSSGQCLSFLPPLISDLFRSILLQNKSDGTVSGLKAFHETKVKSTCCKTQRPRMWGSLSCSRSLCPLCCANLTPSTSDLWLCLVKPACMLAAPIPRGPAQRPMEVCLRTLSISRAQLSAVGPVTGCQSNLQNPLISRLQHLKVCTRGPTSWISISLPHPHDHHSALCSHESDHFKLTVVITS